MYVHVTFPGKYLDILAISCDSFNEETNIEIGRRQGNKNHLSGLCRIREWCRDYRVAFKINTVVNTHNLEEDMSQEIMELSPIRWKVMVHHESINYKCTLHYNTVSTPI